MSLSNKQPDDLLADLITLRDTWVQAARGHEDIYRSTNYQDKRSLAYADMLGAVVSEIDKLISKHHI